MQWSELRIKTRQTVIIQNIIGREKHGVFSSRLPTGYWSHGRAHVLCDRHVFLILDVTYVIHDTSIKNMILVDVTFNTSTSNF